MQSENEIFQQRMKDVFICPICGATKAHYRLYGYRCPMNPEHNEMAHMMNEKQLAEARKKPQDENEMLYNNEAWYEILDEPYG